MKLFGKLLIIIFLFLVALSVLTFVDRKRMETNVAQKVTPTPVATSQADSRGDVTVEVTPVTLEKGNEAVFKLTLDTHTVELNYDLLKVAKLTDDKGKTYSPVLWSGGSGGHHLSGELRFPPLLDESTSVTLQLFGIDGIDRTFRFPIK